MFVVINSVVYLLNVLQIGDVADFGTQNYLKAINLI